MRHKIKKAAKAAAWTAAALLVCFLLAAVLPYARSRDVSDDFAAAWDSAALYGTAPCVDRVALVEEPLASLGTRIHLLSEAETRIDVAYYQMQQGGTTDLFLGALLDAAERGVHVRILVDGMSGGPAVADRDYAAALSGHPNIELKAYNPVKLLKPWTLNARMHDKYIIIDDRLLLLGGRNIGDKYFGPEGFDAALSIDRDVLVYNTAWGTEDRQSVLFDVRSYMDSIWDSDWAEASGAEDTAAGLAKRAALLSAVDALRLQYPALFEHDADDYAVWTFPANRVTLLQNGIAPGPKEPRVGYALSSLLLGAETSVVLQSPYVVPDARLGGLLDALGAGSADCTILTNSMASSPNFPAFAAYLGERREILETGAAVFEYQSADAIHAKTYLIDGRMSVVGSFNLDPRSAYIDTELMLAIDSVEFTAHLAEVQQRYLDQSLQVGPDGQYLRSASVAPAEAPLLKQALLQILRLPAGLFKFLI